MAEARCNSEVGGGALAQGLRGSGNACSPSGAGCRGRGEEGVGGTSGKPAEGDGSFVVWDGERTGRRRLGDI